MITVGGIIAQKTNITPLKNLFIQSGMNEYLDETIHKKVGVPPLTFKEKFGLDQLLPRDQPLTVEDVEKVGFRLKPSQIEAYSQYYRYYPTYGEISL